MPIQPDIHAWCDPIQASTPTDRATLACHQGLMAALDVRGTTVSVGAPTAMAGAPLGSRRRPPGFWRLCGICPGARRRTARPSKLTAGVRRRPRRRRGLMCGGLLAKEQAPEPLEAEPGLLQGEQQPKI